MLCVNSLKYKNIVEEPLRNQNKGYIRRDNEKRLDRSLGKPCKSTCQYNCNKIFKEDLRMNIYDQFWSLRDRSKQWSFIIDHVSQIAKKSTFTKGGNRKSYTFLYSLPYSQDKDMNKVVICKKMFLNTLNCGEKMVRTAFFNYNKKKALVDRRTQNK